MTIRQATLRDLPAIVRLSLLLWPHATPEERTDDFTKLLNDPGAAVFLCEAEGQAAGFAQCQLRRDYVEGCDSSPIGYLEGVFVAEAHRRQGAAKALVAACQDWARAQGCSEFASDCELDNTDSLRFHLGVGFEEANRVICFVKRL